MILNKNLAIVVPTYNRVKILKVWLELHAQLMFAKKIQIHIQDNHSTDGTKQLIEEWKKRFKNISFEINKKNIGATKNSQKALNKLSNRFIWMVGDTYLIPSKLINKILLKIQRNSPTFFIVNLKERIKNLKEKYVEANLVCERLSGILSCLSCVIYNKARLGNIKFRKKPLTYFPHTVYILDRLKKHNSKAYWISSSIYTLNLPNKKHWANKSSVFELGCKNWIDSINSITGYSAESKKKAYKAFSQITYLFSLKGAASLRAQGLLSFNLINYYKPYLKKSIGINYLFFYLVAAIPQNFLLFLRKI